MASGDSREHAQGESRRTRGDLGPDVKQQRITVEGSEAPQGMNSSSRGGELVAMERGEATERWQGGSVMGTESSRGGEGGVQATLAKQMEGLRTWGERSKRAL